MSKFEQEVAQAGRKQSGIPPIPQEVLVVIRGELSQVAEWWGKGAVKPLTHGVALFHTYPSAVYKKEEIFRTSPSESFTVDSAYYLGEATTMLSVTRSLHSRINQFPDYSCLRVNRAYIFQEDRKPFQGIEKTSY